MVNQLFEIHGHGLSVFQKQEVQALSEGSKDYLKPFNTVKYLTVSSFSINPFIYSV